MRTKKYCTAFLCTLFLFASIVAAALFVQPAAAAEREEGYHVGTSINLSDPAQAYTDETYTDTGVWDADGNYWRVTPGKQTVYEAVFPADADSAWIGMSIVGHVTNAKIEISNDVTDESSWQVKLASEEKDGAIAFPENPDCIVLQSRAADNTRHCYIDATDLLAEGQPTHIYLRLSEGFENRGNETGLFELKFFEGNIFDSAYTVLAAHDLTSNVSSLNEDSWFAHSGSLANGDAPGIDGAQNAYFDQYRYGLWTIEVPANASEFAFTFLNQNANSKTWEIAAYANGKRVYYAEEYSALGDNGAPAVLSISLTEAYKDCFGTEFRATIMISDGTKADGNGPNPQYLEFSYGAPALTDENLLPKPDAGTNVITKNEACKFDVAAAVSGLEALADEPIGLDNDYVAAFKGSFSEGKPFFDGNAIKGTAYYRSYGIFKLPYRENSGEGYIKINVSGTYVLSVCADEENALAKVTSMAGDRGFDIYSAYRSVASSLTRVEGQDLYVDVSNYLNPEGGTLYIHIADPATFDGNGPLLQNEIVLYTYGEDTTPFTASYEGGKVWLGSSSTDVVVNMSSLAAGETVTVVKIGDTQLKSADWSFADGKVSIERSAFETAGTGTHTVTLISGANDARTSSVTVEVVEDSVVGISVSAAPSKTTYAPGAALDFAGGALEVTYASGAKNIVAMTESGVIYSAETAQSTEGSQTITVNYAGQSAMFEITVTASAQSGEEDSGEEQTGGCSGSLLGGTVAIGAVFLLLIGCLLAIRKKKS